MSELRGVGIGLGVAQGPVVRMTEALPAPDQTPSTVGAEAERARVREAVAVVAQELTARGEAAGGSAQEVLEAQAMIAEDPTLQDEVDERIDAGSTAEWAVHDAFAGFKATLEAVGGYLGERAADLDDIAQRVLARLRGVEAPGVPNPGHPFVLVARDLAPADTALLDLDQVLALITSDGGPTSHTAILAREKGIVAIVGATEAATLATGTTVIVDAAAGIVTADPAQDALDRAAQRAAERASADAAPATPGALADGTAIPLLANLGKPADAADAVERGAEGVGLFRTEFLFLSATQAPTIAQQRESYRELLAAFPGKKVVVRMLDAGADKPLAFLNDAHEENPALGLRGLRSLRASEDILREQLTALAEADAATSADLWVMAPMVTTVEETAYFTGLAREYGLKTAGVMVEVPASALLADRVLAHADFASIGTNDLTQYTMAADRLLGSVASFQDPGTPRSCASCARSGPQVLVSASPSASAARPPPIPSSPSCSWASAPRASRWLPQRWRTSATRFERTLDEARNLAELALAADDAAGARLAVVEASTALPPHQKETTS